MQKSYDVVVAGGGMIGATLALALARTGRRVACVDPVALTDASLGTSDSFDRRATACAMSSINLFKRLELWPELLAKASPITDILVSKQGHWGRTRLQAEEINLDAFGYVIANANLGVALERAWGSLADAAPTGYWGQRVVAAKQQSQFMAVALDSGEWLQARLLVVADGGRSQLRESLGVGSHTVHTAQTALVCNLAFEKDGLGRAFERFTGGGPLALLPLGGKHYNLVHCESEAANKALLALDDVAFAESLQSAFGAALGAITDVGKRGMFALDVIAANALTAPRAVILGNAAQALHPVAGQGLNLGLRDVATLVDVLQGEPDCGAPALLSRYRVLRQADRRQMLALTTQLATATTSQQNGALAAGFGAGLAGFGQWSVARKALALRASGFQSAMPSLCLP